MATMVHELRGGSPDVDSPQVGTDGNRAMD
jgi:hypothetical protein